MIKIEIKDNDIMDRYREHREKITTIALDVIDICKKEKLTYEEVIQVLQMSEDLLKKMATL